MYVEVTTLYYNSYTKVAGNTTDTQMFGQTKLYMDCKSRVGKRT